MKKRKNRYVRYKRLRLLKTDGGHLEILIVTIYVPKWWKKKVNCRYVSK